MPDAMAWAAALPKSRSMPTGKNRVRTIIRDGWWTQATLRLRLMATASREFYKLEAKDAQAPQKSTESSPQSLLGLPLSGFPKRVLTDGLIMAPREGSAGSLPRFRNSAASELSW